MPTRADVERATPTCPRLCGSGEAAAGGDRCGFPLRPLGRAGAWDCRVHGPIDAVEVVPLRAPLPERRVL